MCSNSVNKIFLHLQVLFSLYGIALPPLGQAAGIEGFKLSRQAEGPLLMSSVPQLPEGARYAAMVPVPYGSHTEAQAVETSHVQLSQEAFDAVESFISSQPGVQEASQTEAATQPAAETTETPHNQPHDASGALSAVQHQHSIPEAPLEPHLDRYYLAAAGQQLGLLASLMHSGQPLPLIAASTSAVPINKAADAMKSEPERSKAAPIANSHHRQEGIPGASSAGHESKLLRKGASRTSSPVQRQQGAVQSTRKSSGQQTVPSRSTGQQTGRPASPERALSRQQQSGLDSKIAAPPAARLLSAGAKELQSRRQQSPQDEAMPFDQRSSQAWMSGPWMQQLAAVVATAATAATAAVNAQHARQAPEMQQTGFLHRQTGEEAHAHSDLAQLPQPTLNSQVPQVAASLPTDLGHYPAQTLPPASSSSNVALQTSRQELKLPISSDSREEAQTNVREHPGTSETPGGTDSQTVGDHGHHSGAKQLGAASVSMEAKAKPGMKEQEHDSMLQAPAESEVPRLRDSTSQPTISNPHALPSHCTYYQVHSTTNILKLSIPFPNTFAQSSTAEWTVELADETFLKIAGFAVSACAALACAAPTCLSGQQ